MGKKRSAEEKRLHLVKKLRKLEEKIKNLPESESEDASDLLSLTHSSADIQNKENLPLETNEDIDIPEQVLVEEEIIAEEEKIDESILAILGEPPIVEIKGQSIRKEIAERWCDILKKGLKKEEKDTLSKDNPAFTNCPQMVAPKLNPEVCAAMTEMAKKRDSLIEERQHQVSTVLSCLGMALQFCVKDDIQNHRLAIIKKLNDASRLLCDSIYLDTKGRRSLVLSANNKDMKEYLVQSEPQTYLFGENLSEKIKTAKLVQKSGTDLKISEYNKKFTPKQNIATKNTAANKSLNWRGPPRTGLKMTGAAVGGPSYRGSNRNTRKSLGQKKKEEKPLHRYRK